MPLVRRVARPMLAAIFITAGIDTFRRPGPRAQLAAPLATKIAEAVPVALPKDPVDLVRLDAAVKVVAGLGLATGRAPRLSAAVLAAGLVPTTLAGHPYWQKSDPAERAAQRTHFLKNLSMLGGLLIAAVDTEGRPSLAWRARHRAAAVLPG